MAGAQAIQNGVRIVPEGGIERRQDSTCGASSAIGGAFGCGKPCTAFSRRQRFAPETFSDTLTDTFWRDAGGDVAKAPGEARRIL
jgi:hypothetical protein